ncbi:MAG: DUF4291 domain-containing protein [Myxococcota bacterium]
MLESYVVQRDRWPSSGRHILAHFDATTVVVYQAYRPAIADYALEHQRFGGPFKMDRMTWIKPNFLWMMYRSNWARSEGQERVLAIYLRREAFDDYLAQAVHSSYVSERYATREEWKRRLKSSAVRLQWDPDHAPGGAKEERRAIQLGLRGSAVRRYVETDVVRIEDMTPVVIAQRDRPIQDLETPAEQVYPVAGEAAAHLGLSKV